MYRTFFRVFARSLLQISQSLLHRLLILRTHEKLIVVVVIIIVINISMVVVAVTSVCAVLAAL